MVSFDVVGVVVTVMVTSSFEDSDDVLERAAAALAARTDSGSSAANNSSHGSLDDFLVPYAAEDSREGNSRSILGEALSGESLMGEGGKPFFVGEVGEGEGPWNSAALIFSSSSCNHNIVKLSN